MLEEYGNYLEGEGEGAGIVLSKKLDFLSEIESNLDALEVDIEQKFAKLQKAFQDYKDRMVTSAIGFTLEEFRSYINQPWLVSINPQRLAQDK